MDKKILTLSGKGYKIMKIKRMISARFVRFERVSAGSTSFNGFRRETVPGFTRFRRISSGFAGFRPFSILSTTGFAEFRRLRRVSSGFAEY